MVLGKFLSRHLCLFRARTPLCTKLAFVVHSFLCCSFSMKNDSKAEDRVKFFIRDIVYSEYIHWKSSDFGVLHRLYRSINNKTYTQSTFNWHIWVINLTQTLIIYNIIFFHSKWRTDRKNQSAKILYIYITAVTLRSATRSVCASDHFIFNDSF